MYADNPDFDEKFRNAFGTIAFTVNRHLIEHMMRAQRELGVDYETLVIWGILAHLNVAHLMGGGATRLQCELDAALAEPSNGLRPLKLRDLEQVTRLPRETIRRKLKKLEALGHILQTPEGWVIERGSAEPHLRAFTRETVLKLLLVSDQVKSMLQNG